MKKVLAVVAMIVGIGAASGWAQNQPQTKGVYWAGLGWEFSSNGKTLSVNAWTTNATGQWVVSPQLTGGLSWTGVKTKGSLGACVFNNLIYCFFDNSNSQLQYVTINPSSGNAIAGPTTIAGSGQINGVAATVCNNMIYIITRDATFSSADGINFSAGGSWNYGAGLQVWNVLDATTVENTTNVTTSCLVTNGTTTCTTNSPPGIMIVFSTATYDSKGNVKDPVVLRSGILYPSIILWPLVWIGPIMPAPYYLYCDSGTIGTTESAKLPITQGNLVLGTSFGVPGLADIFSLGLTCPPMPSGSKAACVQLYMNNSNGYPQDYLEQWEYNLASRSWLLRGYSRSQSGMFNLSRTYISAVPWIDTMDPNGTTRLTYMVHVNNMATSNVGAPVDEMSDEWVPDRSDWQVPQYYDNYDDCGGALGPCNWQGLPVYTSDANGAGTDVTNKWKLSQWTLLGVVVPPPFAFNENTDASTLSQVTFGTTKSQGLTTTTTTTTLFTHGNRSDVNAFYSYSSDESFGNNFIRSSANSITTALTTEFTFGPVAETPPGPDTQGVTGWAIFSCPTYITQWFKKYAYDCALTPNGTTNIVQGTNINQDVNRIQTTAVLKSVHFHLATPTDSYCQFPSLLQGLASIPASTDLQGWFDLPAWNSQLAANGNWTPIIGKGSLPELSQGDNSTETYTQSKQASGSSTVGTIYSYESSQGFDLNVDVGVEIGDLLHLGTSLSGGMSWFSSKETDLEAETTVESSIDTTVSCSMTLAGETDLAANHTNGYVRNLTIQPYWLQATSATAPWIPQACSSSNSRPWYITWNVIGWATNDWISGDAGQPLAAAGMIGGAQNQYALTGLLSWVHADGTTTPCAMTADEFDPIKGAVFSVNNHAFVATGTTSRWVRNGALWTYTVSAGVTNDPFQIVMDFAQKTWSFQTTSTQLQQIIGNANGSVKIKLSIPDGAVFTSQIQHDVSTSWSAADPAEVAAPVGVDSLKGAYNSRTGVGHLTLLGHIPQNTQQFGDLVLWINGNPVTFPLLSQPGFLTALQHGKSVSYNRAGRLIHINFGTGKCTATISGKQFQSAMAPQGGAIRVQILVGGKVISDQTFQVQTGATTLMPLR